MALFRPRTWKRMKNCPENRGKSPPRATIQFIMRGSYFFSLWHPSRFFRRRTKKRERIRDFFPSFALENHCWSSFDQITFLNQSDSALFQQSDRMRNMDPGRSAPVPFFFSCHATLSLLACMHACQVSQEREDKKLPLFSRLQINQGRENSGAAWYQWKRKAI